MAHRRNWSKSINIPVFKDKNTETPFRQIGIISEDGKLEAKDDHIFMDWALFLPTAAQVRVVKLGIPENENLLEIAKLKTKIKI